MAGSYYAHLARFVPTSKLFNLHKTTTSVTKYDPDTGKPLQKTLESLSVLTYGQPFRRLDGKEIEKPREALRELERRANDHYKSLLSSTLGGNPFYEFTEHGHGVNAAGYVIGQAYPKRLSPIWFWVCSST